MTREASRRDAVRLLVAGLGSMSWIAVGGCGGGPSGPSISERAQRYDPDLVCTDTSGMWPAEVATRTDNEYTDDSSKKDQYCFNCTNFKPPSKPRTCGACDTVKGPINPLGWCKAWTEKRH
jgi:hypothetical protein